MRKALLSHLEERGGNGDYIEPDMPKSYNDRSVQVHASCMRLRTNFHWRLQALLIPYHTFTAVACYSLYVQLPGTPLERLHLHQNPQWSSGHEAKFCHPGEE